MKIKYSLTMLLLIFFILSLYAITTAQMPNSKYLALAVNVPDETTTGDCVITGPLATVISLDLKDVPLEKGNTVKELLIE